MEDLATKLSFEGFISKEDIEKLKKLWYKSVYSPQVKAPIVEEVNVAHVLDDQIIQLTSKVYPHGIQFVALAPTHDQVYTFSCLECKRIGVPWYYKFSVVSLAAAKFPGDFQTPQVLYLHALQHNALFQNFVSKISLKLNLVPLVEQVSKYPLDEDEKFEFEYEKGDKEYKPLDKKSPIKKPPVKKSLRLIRL